MIQLMKCLDFLNNPINLQFQVDILYNVLEYKEIYSVIKTYVLINQLTIYPN